MESRVFRVDLDETWLYRICDIQVVMVLLEQLVGVRKLAWITLVKREAIAQNSKSSPQNIHVDREHDEQNRLNNETRFPIRRKKTPDMVGDCEATIH